MTPFTRSSLLFTAAALGVGATAFRVSAADLAVVGGTVISATGAPPLLEAVVLIEQGRITAVGTRRSLTIPEGTPVVDARGKYVTPGLIDTNVHLILMIVPEFYVKYEDRLEEIALQAAQVGLKYGVTTMMDSWGPLAPLLRARERLRKGEFVASRILIAGNIVGVGGPFSPYFMTSQSLRGWDLRYGGWVHPMIQQRINELWEARMGPRLLGMTPGELADEMRQYLAKGVDFVKVAVSAHGVGPVEPLMFSPEALRAMRDEVKRAGKHFQTHTFTLESLRLAVEVGPELLQHPNVMSHPAETEAQRQALRALIADIKRKNIYCALMGLSSKEQSRTLREWKAEDHAKDPFLSEIVHSRLATASLEAYERRLAALRPWLEAGVAFTLGTDMGPEAAELGPVVWGRMGRRHFEYMESLQESGADPMEILMGATRRGAEAYGLARDLGTIEAGKIADLLLLDDDPLKDVAHFRKIHLILKDGRVVDRASLPTVRVLDFDPEAPWPR